MTKLFKRSMASLLLFVFVLLTACGQQGADNDKKPEETEVVEDENTEAEENEAKDKVSAVLITDSGGVNDKSFNQSAYEGMTEASEEGWMDFTYIESGSDADYLPNLETALASDSDIIWSIGFALYKPTVETAEYNPDKKFAIIDSANIDEVENLVGVTFADHENSFLVGYIAGMKTETNNVGFIGGQVSPVIDRFEHGFRAGVMHAAREKNADIEVQVQYADSFNDAAKGKSIANQMYEKGADVIFHAAGGVGNGVIESAKENNKWVIGVDRDQSDEAPDHMLVSTVKGVNLAVKEVSKKLLEGNFEGGKNVEFQLDGGGVSIAYGPNDLVAQEVKDKVEVLTQQIIDGEVKVPQNADEFNEMGYSER